MTTRTSSVQNPKHIYRSPGSYTVALTVTGPGGVDIETKTDYIEALPCPYKPVRIGEKNYDLIEDAYQDASQGDTVQCQAMAFREDLVFNRDISLTIRGGYDCDYTTTGGQTFVGSLLIRSGVVTVENLTLLPWCRNGLAITDPGGPDTPLRLHKTR